MLFNIIDSYSKEKIDFLNDLWKKIILDLSKTVDKKKILSFLNKCGIVGVDEKNKLIYIGVSNEFVMSQVNKFFKKNIDISVQETYNVQFKSKFIIFEKFQSGHHQLLINLKDFLGVSEQKLETFDKNTKSKLTNYFGILFDPKFRFDNFIVGSNNELAYSASLQVSQKPGIVYNPLFIYGNVGLGKTHILQAIGNSFLKDFSDKVVVYLPTTKFIDEIIDAIKLNKMQALMKKLEDVDMIILDDIQFLAEKEKTQEIFHNIFNEFHQKKKQIILSSDRSPKELNLLEARLRSRFALGLVVDIKKPDFETRCAIIKSKLNEKGENIDSSYIELIAKFVRSNIREIEGIINIILTKKNLLGKVISINDIYESLETLGYKIRNGELLNDEKINDAGTKNSKSMTNFENIVEFVGNYFNISVYDLKGENRKKDVSIGRQMLMYIAKNNFSWTLEKIGDFFGGKNHATVIYGISNFEKLLKNNKKIKTDFTIIIEEMGL